MSPTPQPVDCSAQPQEEIELHEPVVSICKCGEKVAIVDGIATACTRCGFVFNVPTNSADEITVVIDEYLSARSEQSNWLDGEGERRTGPLTGVMMGHFLLEDVLGSGGMGAVYRALDTSLQRHVAVKVINQIKAGKEQNSSTTAIVREAVAQARMNHPNVVTIYYVGRTSAEPFLAMELVKGQTLRERMAHGPIPYADAIRITIQLIRALEHASRINIVHGDIKPNNLLLDEAGNVKLSDFGLARSTLDNSSDVPLSGTPAYMAPELLAHQEQSIQSDMYAIGVTLFEMAFGKLPYNFEGTTIRDFVDAHTHHQIQYTEPWPVGLPLELKQVIDRLLAKDPGDRYPSYAALLADFQQIRPVSTTTAGIALRAAAFAIDQGVLFLAFLPFAIPLYLTTFETQPYQKYGDMFRHWTLLIACAALIVPLGYFALIRRGRRTFGRYLFQLRVSEQHGLLLPRKRAIVRAMMRDATAWLIAVGLFLSLYHEIADDIVYVVVLIILLVEVIFMVSSSGRRSLHDMICHSRVVLDSKPERHKDAFGNQKATNKGSEPAPVQETLLQL